MYEWQVFGVFAAIIGLLAMVVKPIVSLNTAITKLTVAVEGLQKDLGTLTAKNDEEHEKLRRSIG